VCIATPVALKGWTELLNAIQLLGDDFNGWQLLMVAPPRDNKDALNLTQRATELGIKDRVRHIPGLGTADLAEVLRASDAFVLASYNEGMANALLEAMASGLPCVATEVGGHNEVMENGVSGLLIPPKSAEEIATALRIILTNPILRTTMGTEARKRMIQFGDYLDNAKKLLALFSRK
jgi:glycosyltransferase involved in cell wall biosynthesis